MADNNRLNIPLIPFLPKPEANFIFIGRDPSPRTATTVGTRDSRSVFINEIFRIVDKAGLLDNYIYITDMCKCHWRTSRGTPYEGTENRSKKLPNDVAKACIKKWLIKEIEILNPKAIFTFGEELYKKFYNFITDPITPPKMFSASRDKSVMDAELYYIKFGPMKIKLGETETIYVPLRHAGSSGSLPRNELNDKRWSVYQESVTKVVKLLTSLG
jgi:uracil-DNA glycosylase